MEKSRDRISKVKTTAYLKEKFGALGYELVCPKNITGFIPCRIPGVMATLSLFSESLIR